MDRERSTTPSGGRLRQVTGYLLAGAALVWVFYDIHPERLAGYLRELGWAWVGLAIACDILGYFCEGARWHFLLKPVGRLPILRATQVIYIGLFTNEIMPLRFGELVRLYLVSRWTDRSLAAVVPSMLTARLIDGLWLALAVGCTAVLVPLPAYLLRAGDVLGAAVLLLLAALAWLILARYEALARWSSEPGSGSRLRRALQRFLGQVALGLRDIGASRFLLAGAVFSLGLLVCQTLAFWLVTVAYRLPLALWQAWVVFLILHLGTAIPNAPANVGSYQFFTVLGLTLFGIDKTQAAGFSVVVFLILTLPLWILGLFAMARSGLSVSGLRRDVQNWLAQRAG